MTDAEFSRQLSELSAMATELNRESNSTNELLSRFEEQISTLNVGIEASQNMGVGVVAWLKLTRTSTKPGASPYAKEEYWGLAIDGRPALEASRDLRIAALENLPYLITTLTTESRNRLDVIKRAKKLVK